MKKIIASVAFVLLISLALTGCGGGGKDLSSSKEPASSGDSAPVSDPIAQGTIELEGGGEINFGTGEIGENMELPAEFPADILPLLDDARIYHVNTNDANKAIGIVFLSEKSFAEAVAFYKEVMKNGEVNMENEDNGVYIAAGSKGDYAVSISITTSDNKTNILLDATPKSN
jgi:predicted small secreted protein